mmetsp:Transcript_81232/g.230549  ORF Transcript_81232/g.230549 Transcript_81232/m.230549 type:complete len:207 (+) Transcript_81232:269-889(+)
MERNIRWAVRSILGVAFNRVHVVELRPFYVALGVHVLHRWPPGERVGERHSSQVPVEYIPFAVQAVGHFSVRKNIQVLERRHVRPALEKVRELVLRHLSIQTRASCLQARHIRVVAQPDALALQIFHVGPCRKPALHCIFGNLALQPAGNRRHPVGLPDAAFFQAEPLRHLVHLGSAGKEAFDRICAHALVQLARRGVERRREPAL